MADVGVKLAIPGADVKGAADVDLIYSSSWPTTNIVANIQVSFPSPANASREVILYKHGLGYVPFYLVYHMSGTTLGSVPVYAEVVGGSFVEVDEQYVYFKDSGHSLAVTWNLSLIVFSVDITKPFLSTSTKGLSSPKSLADHNFGIKLSKTGKDIDDTDLRNFIIHSASRAPLIHAVVPGTTDGNGNFSYTPNLPYNPAFMAYVKIANSNNPGYQMVNDEGGLSTSGGTINLSWNANTPISIVILKDPLNAGDNTVNVNL